MDGKEIEQYVEDNPKKPYKMYAAMASAFITTFVAGNVDLNPYVEAGAVGLVAAIGVYIARNPKREKEKAPGNIAGDLYLGE
jgi:hypothetical protein